MNNELDIDRIYLYTKDLYEKISIFHYQRRDYRTKAF